MLWRALAPITLAALLCAPVAHCFAREPSEASRLTQRYFSLGDPAPRIELRFEPGPWRGQAPQAQSFAPASGPLCVIVGLREDYASLGQSEDREARRLGRIATPALRDGVAIHEYAHCLLGQRIAAPSALEREGWERLPVEARLSAELAQQARELFAEAFADALATLRLARVDGIHAAREYADAMEALRDQEQEIEPELGYRTQAALRRALSLATQARQAHSSPQEDILAALRIATQVAREELGAELLRASAQRKISVLRFGAREFDRAFAQMEKASQGLSASQSAGAP